MIITQIVNALASATPTSKTIGIQSDANNPGIAYWEVTVSATGSVSLQGSMDNVNFFTLPLVTGAAGAAITASGISTTARFPYMRAVVTANTGTITVFIGV